MSFTKTFPYDIGTNVKVHDRFNPDGDILYGSVACYNCVRRSTGDFTIVVSGLKEPWCGEYYCGDVELATEEEVKAYYDKMKIEGDCEE